MAPSAELLVAKVVSGDDLIDVEAEVKAIQWAVKNGARVINMSLGGFRDPRDADRDAYSQLEAAAIAYAHGKGVVVVAAVGNSEEMPPKPWPFASYPAALPHVLGVSALARDGSVPAFSNRDKIYNDIAAPGEAIVSTFPLALTAATKECTEQGYSTCAVAELEDFRKGEGTSFAAPQVSAAAAVLLAVRPHLRPEQVTELLTRTARDVSAATGCRAVPAAARRAHRLGPARRHGGAASALRRDPGQGPPRAERRRRRPGCAALGSDEPDRGDPRLLGRPERRLRDPAATPAARLHQRPRPGRLRREPDPLEPRHDADRRARVAAARSRASRPGRAPGSGSRTARPGPASTTSR